MRPHGFQANGDFAKYQLRLLESRLEAARTVFASVNAIVDAGADVTVSGASMRVSCWASSVATRAPVVFVNVA